MRVFTIGHSTHALEEFVDLLRRNGIRLLVDVRTLPGSRAAPQFNSDALSDFLERSGIEYFWMPELGGLRKPRKDSKNTCWRNASFRGFADYMETPEFDSGIGRLLKLAARKTVAIMCAEALYWRCHRSMIADYLRAGGVEVFHIMPDGRLVEHEYSACARVGRGVLSYH